VNKITKSIISRLDIWEEKVQDGGGFNGIGSPS
jgi:hypothetical protein